MNPLRTLDDAGSILDDLPEWESSAPTRFRSLSRKLRPQNYERPIYRGGKPLALAACFCASCCASRKRSREFLKHERRRLAAELAR